MAPWQGQHAGTYPPGTTAVPDRAFFPPAFALGNAPGGTSVGGGIHQVLVALPAQHEAQLKAQEQAEPKCGGKALIEDMDDLAAPLP